MSRHKQEQPGKQILALDFEGVLCDSSKECMLVAWYGTHGASVEAFGTRGWHKLPPAFVERFLAYRPFMHHLGHFLVPMLSDLPRIVSQEAFQTAYASLEAARRERFIEQVSQYRQQVRVLRTATWLQMHVWYPRIAYWLRRFRQPVYIVTARDRASVLTLLESKSIVLAPDHVFGERVSKLEALATIVHREQISPQALTFIDDHPEHVRSARQKGYQAFFASWGYGVLPAEGPQASSMLPLRLPDLLTGRFPSEENPTHLEMRK